MFGDPDDLKKRIHPSGCAYFTFPKHHPNISHMR